MSKLHVLILAAGTIASKINVTPKGVILSEKLQLTVPLCNEVCPQKQI